MPSGKVVWNRRLQFVGTSGSGHGIVVDTLPEQGGLGAGPSNTELLLIALCGCTGMDVVTILGKKRVAFDDFEVAAEGVIHTELPKRLSSIQLVYRIWGQDVPENALRHAIELSKNKYCTVSNSLDERIQVEYRYEINP
ncbi:MAG: OsmC family protein [Gemmatimonadota bacterium]|nr:MAG: OsmC family protein [Gemmatimonadota bacterium]